MFASTGNIIQAGYHYRFKVLLGDDGFVVEPDSPTVSGRNEAALSGSYEVVVDD